MAASLKTKLALVKARMRGRVRRGASMGMNAVKPIAISGAVGAAAQLAGGMIGQNIDFVRNNWYGEGAALAAGAFLLRKNPAISHALAGAAGYSMAMRKRAASGGTGQAGGNAGDTGYLQNQGAEFGAG